MAFAAVRRETRGMTSRPITVLLCTDGSDLALSALRQGLELLTTPDRVVVLTVTSGVDPTLVTGTGFAGGVMSFEEKADLVEAQREAAQAVLDDTIRALGLTDGETLLKTGDAGRIICEVAEALPASVVVLGTHGHSGLRRAVMGSTSDYVVRHAVCPVLVQQDPG
jgi:nucleotide-binding universal stress UspA family protein